MFAVFPVVVVTGARQVGKSTLLANTLGKKIDTIVFDPVLDVENARQDPELFLNNRPPPMIAALTAQEINHSEIGRALGIPPQTGKRWLEILKATFQWFEILAFSGNAIKKVSGKPKGYISDTGLACAAQSISSPNAIGGHPLWGALFETAAATEIRKQCSF